MAAVAAGISGLFFEDSRHEEVEKQDDRNTKRSFVQYPQHHFKTIPFAGLKQRIY
jgi:hypothetical protein